MNSKIQRLILAKRCYDQGGNATQFLKELNLEDFNSPETIEIAYELQAGTYVESYRSDPDKLERYANEYSQILRPHIQAGDRVLDVGSGELTMLSLVAREALQEASQIYAFDLSWSRLSTGIEFAREVMGASEARLKPFVAEIGEIPLMPETADVTISSHALEPNGESLKPLLRELFRVTRRRLLLFEPYYEGNTDAGQKRMDQLGYIKNIEGSIEETGGKLIEIRPIEHPTNPLNPTACFLIEPPSVPKAEKTTPSRSQQGTFAIPGTNHPLEHDSGFLVSKEIGVSFPILHGIPILRNESAVLSTRMSRSQQYIERSTVPRNRTASPWTHA